MPRFTLNSSYIQDRPGTRGWMAGTHALLTSLGLTRFWQDPGACVLMDKEQWKEVVYEAVESAEHNASQHAMLVLSGGRKHH